ncbi:MAG: glycosyltransferase, partial [Acidobacteriaceae bacterium]
VLVHLSNFRPVKRIQDVIRIFAGVAKEMPARLLMVGDGPDRSSAEWLAKSLKISDRVSFLGKHDQVNQLLPAADLMLMPSELESFGLAALEAMACEVPTIATNVGGVPELIQDGVTGLLFPVGDVDSMTAAAVGLLKDRGRLIAMAKAGRAEAQRTYCASRVIPKYEEFYESILRNSGS